MAVLLPMGSPDYVSYVSNFDELNAQPFTEGLRKDPLYFVAVRVFGHLGGAGESFYWLLAALALGVKLTALRRLGGGSSMVVLLYMCSYFYLHEFIQVRAALAIGLWMHALLRLERSGFQAFLLTALASMVHLQALLGFVVLGVHVLIRSRWMIRLACLAAVAVVLLAATSVLDQWGYSLLLSIPDPRTEIYVAAAAQDLWVRPNPFSAINLLALSTALAGLLTRRAVAPQDARLDPGRRVVFLSLLMGSCALGLLSAVSVAAFRVSEHFFALLPVGVWLIASRGGYCPSHRLPLLGLAGLLAYIFLFHSAHLLNPATGEQGVKQ